MWQPAVSDDLLFWGVCVVRCSLTDHKLKGGARPREKCKGKVRKNEQVQMDSLKVSFLSKEHLALLISRVRSA